MTCVVTSIGSLYLDVYRNYKIIHRAKVSTQLEKIESSYGAMLIVLKEVAECGS